MNDATRELGAALGVAVLGSIAASQFSSHLHQALHQLPAASRSSANASIAGALEAARHLPGAAAQVFDTVARTAFVDGIHLASVFGALLALAAAFVTTRYLPRSLPDEGALHSGIESMENVAELGLGGVPPVFAGEPHAATVAPRASASDRVGLGARAQHGVADGHGA
jgi:hypothetical protein